MSQPARSSHRETPSASPPEPTAAARLSLPLDVRSLSLTLLAVLAIIYTLHLAQAFLIPLVLSILLGYALDPLVQWLGRWKIPRALSAAVLVVTLIAGIGSLAFTLRDDASALVDQLPSAAQHLRERMQDGRNGTGGAIQKMQQAAKELEKVAAEATGSRPASKPAAPPTLDLTHYMWWGSVGALGFAGQIMLILFLVYFILAAGDLYKRKLVKLAGPTLTSKRVTVEILDDINRQIERFLIVQLFTSVVAAVLTWIAFAWIGLDHAVIWGFAAGVGNFIPYIGPLVIAVLITIAGFLQFETFTMAAFIAMVSLGIKGFVGFVLTPWLMSRAAKMNPVAVFVGLLFWGWMWGLWGMLLAMPMIMAVKVVCDHVEGLKGIGELLGE